MAFLHHIQREFYCNEVRIAYFVGKTCPFNPPKKVNKISSEHKNIDNAGLGPCLLCV